MARRGGGTSKAGSAGRGKDLPAYDPNDLAVLRRYSSGRTARSQDDQVFAAHALGVLAYQPAFGWLCPSREAARLGEGKIIVTVLAELGRIPNDRRLRAIAREICSARMKALDAIALIRRRREPNGRAPPARQ